MYWGSYVGQATQTAVSEILELSKLGYSVEETQQFCYLINGTLLVNAQTRFYHNHANGRKGKIKASLKGFVIVTLSKN